MTTGAPQPGDVRMRGFEKRALVADVLRWIDSHAAPLEAERIHYLDAHGRVLAADVVAPIDVPAFDRSAMDGYALRGAETDGAGDYNPLSFPVVGESLPGEPFAGELPPGRAARIMTGAPLPAGADAVVPAEYAAETDGTVSITTSVSPFKHVGRTGEDVQAGETLLKRGRRLRPQDVGLLASLGMAEIDVVRRPHVRLLITGNELVSPGEEKSAFQIYESNSAMLHGLVARDGGIVSGQAFQPDASAEFRPQDSYGQAGKPDLQPLPDDRDAIRAALTAPGADVILVSGGSSVGAEDHAPSLLAAEGELAFHGVAMRPSSPSGVGRIGSALVFLLPGNPVSCLCAYDFFAGRAIRLLGGRTSHWPYVSRRLPLERKIASAIGRVDYCRVAIVEDRLQPLALSGASILSSTTRADGFVVVPAEREGYPPGREVTVFLYDAPA